ncbi:hypothetical protein NQ315_014771, partial [Exocentrus adspersus]
TNILIKLNKRNKLKKLHYVCYRRKANVCTRRKWWNSTTGERKGVLLAYFFNVDKHFAASSMWTKYSMLKSMLKVHKVGSRKYKTKKAKILKRNQIEEFLKRHQMWNIYKLRFYFELFTGCIDPGSRAGACRCNELTFLDISDVQDKGSYLYVLIPDTKTNISKSFTVMEEAFSVNAVEMCRKYISLRPKAAGRRFFLRCVDGKCTTQHVGINTISKTFSKVASFLGLPDPESFTGHGMRRSWATLLANAGGDITTVKRHGGWKSTTVAENYIEESLSSKMAIAEKIHVLPNVGEVVGPSSTSETPHRVNLNPGQNNKVVFELNVNVNINNNSK